MENTGVGALVSFSSDIGNAPTIMGVAALDVLDVVRSGSPYTLSKNACAVNNCASDTSAWHNDGKTDSFCTIPAICGPMLW